jgi:hypothetical protein
MGVLGAFGGIGMGWDGMADGSLPCTFFWFELDEIEEQKFPRTKWKTGTAYLPLDFLLDRSSTADGKT